MSSKHLQGLRVLNTRPKGQYEALSLAIEKSGGRAINCPGLYITPLSIEWLAKLPPLSTEDIAIFTSTNAVRFFFSAFQEVNQGWTDAPSLYAIGNSTAKALLNLGREVRGIAPDSNSESLLALDTLKYVQNKHILLITGKGGRKLIANTLSMRQANWKRIEVYERTPPSFLEAHILLSSLTEQDVDILLFTSQASMMNIITIYSPPAWFFKKPCLVISQRLAAEAQKLGFLSILVCRPDNILNALIDFKRGSWDE